MTLPFDWSKEIEAKRRAAKSGEERLCARTAVGYELFVAAVEKAGWHLLHRGVKMSLPCRDLCLLVGIATWSDPDLVALNRLHSQQSLLTYGFDVFAFDIDQCSTLSDLQAFAPDVGEVTQTPVVATYKSGTLMFTVQGAAALTWLAKLPASKSSFLGVLDDSFP